MTGVGAIFELYEHWNGKREKKKQAESKRNVAALLAEQQDAPAEEEEASSIGVADFESEWHGIIRNNDWDGLWELLQNYDYKLYKENPPEKPRRRLRMVRAAISAKEYLMPPRVGEQQISPLLGKDAMGQSPLHIICTKHDVPDRVLLRMILVGKRAAAITDNDGQLPLHIAICNGASNQVVDKLMRAHVPGIQKEDLNGRTALWHCVQQQTQQREGTVADADDSYSYWGIPRTQKEQEWQTKQEAKWQKVRFMLLAYSTRRKVLIPSEHAIFLQVIAYAAPPSVVELVLFAGQQIIKQDPTLASVALSIFMRRRYSTKNLQLLLHHFPVQNVEAMDAARKLLTNHYHMGCVPASGSEISFRGEMEKRALDENCKPSLDSAEEWWDKIKCLLRLCGHGNVKEDKQDHLLHAALSNPDTPPSLVQLLMTISPKSIALAHPHNDAPLIHLICLTWKYNLYPHSKNVGLDFQIDEPPMEQVLRLILASDNSLVRKWYKGRLPLHHAIATSKSWAFLQSIVKLDNKSLMIRDSQTKLYPFQLAALLSNNQNRNAALWAHNQLPPGMWMTQSHEFRANAVEKVIEAQELEQLSIIFNLLREFPAAVSTAAVLRKPAIFRDATGKGMVSTHFIVWCYKPGANNCWEVQQDRLELLRGAIRTRSLPQEMEGWFKKLKFWIWYCYPKELGGMCKGQHFGYLLHTALANEDTPPILIELLLALFPTSASMPVFGTYGLFEYPLHIAARTPAYTPQPFEVTPDINSCFILEMLVNAFPAAAKIRSSQGGTPIEIATKCGKTCEEIRSINKSVHREIDQGNFARKQLTHSLSISGKYVSFVKGKIDTEDETTISSFESWR
jgi:hypothetical protein